MEDRPIQCVETCGVTVYRRTESSKQTVSIIQEVFITVWLNGREMITIACNGSYLKELAVGFLRAEGWIEHASDISRIDVSEEQNLVHVVTKDGVCHKKNNLNAPDMIASSGARGWKSDKPIPCRVDLMGRKMAVSVNHVFNLMERFVDMSGLHKTTGGTHSAALADSDDMLVVREDIGRHNAIDMLSGYTLLNGIDCSDKIIVRTGRVSAEIVHKVWSLGAPVMISLSVPTSMAVKLCKDAGMTLIGAVRNEKMHVYCHEWRIER